MYDFDSIVNRNTPDDIKYEKVEGIDDLKVFDKKEFVGSLFSREDIEK